MEQLAAEPGFSPDASARPAKLARLSRRARQRRHMLDLIAASYLIDCALLLLYGLAGTIPLVVVPAYGACSLILAGVQIALSESGFNDRFADHYLSLPASLLNLAMMIVFSFWMPQIGFLFLCTLFIIFGLTSLNARLVQNLIVWTAMTAALAALFLLSDRAVEMPHGSLLERFTTMLTLALTIGRCMVIGMFSSAMRESLYKRGVQLREAYQRIEELAELDELTGSFNRRCIMRLLDDEIARSGRAEEPLSLALIDLDWFKRINDTYGHPTGDEVLRTFAIAIFANIRSFDRFGRYGGEEFLLLMPNTGRDEAVAILERLRVIVADLDWTAFSPGMRITLSAGVATMSQDESADAALARADGALYAAKQKGRNTIATAS